MVIVWKKKGYKMTKIADTIAAFFVKSKYSRMTILVLVILMSVVVLPFDVSAKLKTKSGTTKTFAFISTDGEVCSAKVYSTIGQNYTVSGKCNLYKKNILGWTKLCRNVYYTTNHQYYSKIY